jgi:hypothetical protein
MYKSLAMQTRQTPLYPQLHLQLQLRLPCRLLWRGEPLEVDFYAFWRVRLALHVTTKGICHKKQGAE